MTVGAGSPEPAPTSSTDLRRAASQSPANRRTAVRRSPAA